MTLYTGVVHRPLPPEIAVRTTLSRGRWRIPYRAVGQLRAQLLHDLIVARALPGLVGQIDVIHAWPLAARQTLTAARRLGIPTVLERCNAHTRYAYEVVARESARLGVTLPRDHEHAFNLAKLRLEEEEYRLADRLLCPSDFVVKTFRDQGFSDEQLVRHTYGYDDSMFYPAHPRQLRPPGQGLQALFVGVCAVRKGLHFALDAWIHSSASTNGTFRIVGDFLPSYEERLSGLLAHPTVEVLGHRDDVPQLMRESDVLLLPSIEEGYGLTCVEAIASGCVPLVSDACTEECVHDENALVHGVGDVTALTEHINLLNEDRVRLARLRAQCLASAGGLTWTKAGQRLLQVYEQVVAHAAQPAQSTEAHAGTTVPVLPLS